MNMQKLFLYLALIPLGIWAQDPPAKSPSKILVVYFSHSGNTRAVAKMVQEQTGGDLFEIVPEKSYPQDYDAVVAVAKKEKAEKARPALKMRLQNKQNYDVIFIGFPNWWGTFPMAVATFLEDNDFAGKTLIPFCTHEGSYMGSSEKDLAEMEPQAKILQGLPIRGRSVKKAKEDVSDWLKKSGVMQR